MLQADGLRAVPDSGLHCWVEKNGQRIDVDVVSGTQVQLSFRGEDKKLAAELFGEGDSDGS